MQFEKLFEPGNIGSMQLKNRLILAPLGHYSADTEGHPTSRTIDFYTKVAEGGVGLIITGGSSVRREGRNPKMLWFFSDGFVPKLKELTQAVHAFGAKIAPHLVDFGKAHSDPGFGFLPGERDLIAASPLPFVRTGFVPREATKSDINYLVKCFAEAGRRTKEAGFDAVEIMAGHGYTVSTFMSPFFNRRTDEYGGSVEKRARIVCEIIECTRNKVGPDFPIILRVSASEYLEGGITIDDAVHQAPLFVEAGVDALHISASALETSQWQFLPYLYPPGAIVHLAEAIKKTVRVPVIAVGKLDNPILANQVLIDGKSDFISIGRALMADPMLPKKFKEGRLNEICHCIYCNNCITTPQSERMKFGGNFCTVNPALFREKEFAIKLAVLPKKIMVVGGGLAGMEVARVLSERGHKVSLYEKCEIVGGQWNIASRQESKEGYKSVTERLFRGLSDVKVNLVLNKEVTVRLVKEIKPDVVVVATGAVPAKPEIPGIDGQNVVQANDVIIGKAKAGRRVVVLGGRLLGMEIAVSLSKQGKSVSLATRHRIGGSRRIDVNTYRALMSMLIDNGVHLYPDSPVIEIRDNGVYIDYNHELLFLRADTVVLATGAKAENKLVNELDGIVPELYAIGDCVTPRDALTAIREGAELGRQI